MMIRNVSKISFLVIFNMAIICSVNQAEAFPLPSLDISRIKTAIENTMHAVQEIKQEIESNIQIIKEIQNGGFMAAAGDLFGKIQAGDYDRFGQNLKAVGTNTRDVGDAFGAAKRENQTMKEEMAKGLTREQAKEAARQKEIQRQQAKQKEKYESDLEKARQKAVKRRAKELRKENPDMTEKAALAAAEKEYAGKTLEQIRLENQAASKLNNTYRWLQNNSVATSSGLDAIQAVKDGNWSQALVSAGTGTGSGFMNSGSEEFGAFIQSGAALTGGVMDAAQSGSVNEAYQALKYNYGGALDNLADMGQAAQDYTNNRAAEEDAATQPPAADE